MDDLTLASNPADADAAEWVEQHHAVLAGQLDLLLANLVAAANDGGVEHAQGTLAAWCQGVLRPHLSDEADTWYPAAREVPQARLLVEAMIEEQRTIDALAQTLASTTDASQAVTTAAALEALFRSHLAKTSAHLVPALVASPDHDVATMAAGIQARSQEASSGSAPEPGTAPSGHGAGGCSCGEADPTGYPELDARAVPHKIRHATIFGALDAVASGNGMVLVAPHDPLPLLAQLEQRAPGAFEVSYLERGPEAWRLQLVRH